MEPLESNDPLTAEVEVEGGDSHELMIKRLQRELGQRQELQSQLISILQEKQKIELELEKKKLKIEDLRSHLQNLFKVKLKIKIHTYLLINVIYVHNIEF